MLTKVKEFFGGMGFNIRIQSPADKRKLLLEDPDVQRIATAAYDEGRHDVLYAKTYKTKETLIQTLKEIL